MLLPTNQRFRFLEHRADAYIAAYGETLEEAFENAALATFETMTDTSMVEPRLQEAVEVEGFDQSSLLYNWLEALLVRFETEGRLYSKFEVSNIEKTRAGYGLEAKIYGERFDPEKHASKAGVKAVTYHRMEIRKAAGRVELRFVLDI
jgi:SHS2 domain-containing protein